MTRWLLIAMLAMGMIGCKKSDKKEGLGEAPKSTFTKKSDEKPAAAPEAKKAEEKPAAAPEAKKAEEKPAAAPEAKKAEEKPAVAPEAKKAEEKPAAAPEAKKAEEKPAAKPVLSAEAPQKTAVALVQLPDDINTPDGMCLLPDGSVLVSAPNINDPKQAPWILRLTKDNKIEKFFEPIKHPDTNRGYPFGICVDPASGDVYYADMQWFADTKKPNYKSRVVHIHMKDGKPDKTTILASGMVISNAVIVRDGYLYTTDTMMKPDSKPLVSGIYRFKLGEENVEMKQPLEKDPHCIATILSNHPTIPFGSDGLTFDAKGNLYCGNFADGTVHKLEFDAKGEPKKSDGPLPVWAKAPFMKSCDGITYDPKTDKIYVADSQANAIQAVSMDGSVQCLAQEPTFDGADGKMDQPCEVVFRGRDMIISNFDMPVEGGVNKKFEMPQFLSIIRME